MRHETNRALLYHQTLFFGHRGAGRLIRSGDIWDPDANHGAGISTQKVHANPTKKSVNFFGQGNPVSKLNPCQVHVDSRLLTKIFHGKLSIRPGKDDYSTQFLSSSRSRMPCCNLGDNCGYGFASIHIQCHQWVNYQL